jgi:hypothetical protein
LRPIGDCGIDMPDSRADTEAPIEIDTSVAHEARVYDYWLGGKDNYPAERAARRAIATHIPAIRSMAHQSDFLGGHGPQGLTSTDVWVGAGRQLLS